MIIQINNDDNYENVHDFDDDDDDDDDNNDDKAH